MNKIKIYSIYSDEFTEMAELFKQSFLPFSENIKIELIYSKKKGEYVFHDIPMRFFFITKIGHILRTIRENIGSVIVWSDIDIICVKNPYDRIIDISDKYDFSALKDADIRHGSFNVGFMIIKCNENMTRLWEDILKFILLKPSEAFNKKKFPLIDESIINYFIKKSGDIKYSILPYEFFGYYQINNPDEKKIFHYEDMKNMILVHFAGRFDWSSNVPYIKLGLMEKFLSEIR